MQLPAKLNGCSMLYAIKIVVFIMFVIVKCVIMEYVVRGLTIVIYFNQVYNIT